MELPDAASRALDAALDAGAEAAEAYAQESNGREIRIFAGEVESLTDAGQRGVGVRTWIGGRVGYAYGTDLSDAGVAEVAGASAEAARVADPDEFAAPPQADGAGSPPEIPGLSDPAVEVWGTDRKVELAKAVEAAARQDPRIEAVETTVYVDESLRVEIASSTGLRGSADATSCYAFLQAIAADGADKQTGLGFGVGRSPEALDAEAIGAEAARRATSLLGAAKPASRTCPVVLDETVAASFFGFIAGLLCADAVQRGRSPFAGQVGQQIAAAALTLTDDALDPEGLASAPFDGEGLPHSRTPLIEAGSLAAYLHDSYTARREGAGTRSTASAERSSYRAAPSVGPSNLIVGAGEMGFEELVREAGEGMYVTDVAGLHSGVNPVSGTFSVGATGRVISGGELAEAADEFTIASDLPAMLHAVRATGADARWVPFGGSVKTPPVLIGEMAIAGA
jgi:PmbA protein